MRLDEILSEPVRVDLSSIQYQVDIDSEGDNNRGWTVHKITAHNREHDELGYIKISYIPNERFPKYYPTIFHFLAQISGKTSLVPFDHKSPFSHYKDWSLSDLQKVAERFSSYRLRVSEFRGDKESKSDLIDYFSTVEKELNKGSAGKDFQSFKDYHVDKPIVDYIQVHNQFRRNGISVQLYLRAADLLNNIGLRLHASKLQSQEAQAVWKYLEANYSVKITKDGRQYLEPEKS